MHQSPAAKLQRPITADTSIHQPRDPNTLANYNAWKSNHIVANLNIDFERKRAHGKVTLQLTRLHDNVDKIILDTSFLDISSVEANGHKAEFNVGARIEPYGSPLTITVPSASPAEVKLEISMSTTDKCTALQWMTAAQTSNGKHPYMFSQCQAIHARSLYPCQDTPDVKQTFEFILRSPLPVLASGRPAGITDVKEGIKEYTYKQPVPMTSYLFAVASGDIAGAQIGPRSAVWTGPEELEGCKWELEKDTENFIKIAEDIVFPYAWGEYNVLVLPSSFPYGGMENPQWTYATPTIISKDRENVDVIAHELAHSWSGNLVSNASWEHFWLNEGWTVYLERRIQAAVHGEAYRDFSSIIGWKALTDSINGFGEDHEFTKLIVELKGKDPDDAFSSIPYEKGFTFLYYLEKLVGKDRWDKFIPHYFKTFAYKSLDSYEFKATLLDFFAKDAEASKKLTDLDWDKWFYTPGFPEKPDFDTSLADECFDLADKWESLNKSGTAEKWTPRKSDIEGWMGQQIYVFLERLQQLHKPLTPELVAKLGSTYDFASSYNVEISSRYFRIGLQSHAQVVYEPTAELLGRVGRMKFVRPLYKGLLKCDAALAKRTFQKNKDFYHPICRAMVEKDLYGK